MHEEAIACLTWWKLVRGEDASRFSPELSLTRGQAATVLANLVRATDTPETASSKDAFTDDGDSVHQANLNALAAVGIIRGDGQGQVNPGGQFSRGQLASLIVRTYTFVTGTAPAPGTDPFSDIGDSVHADDINAAAAMGWVAGTTATTFAPHASTSRGQASSTAARMLALLVGAKHATLPK